MRALVRRKVWVSVFTCSKCGRKKEIWHHGVNTKKEACADIPSCGEQDGWKIYGKILCSTCTTCEIVQVAPKEI